MPETSTATSGPTAALIIEDVGWLTTLQDRGRHGYGALGVVHGGPVDPSLADAMNRSVGNDHGTVVLETAGGLVIRAETEITVACSAHIAPTPLSPGERLRVEIPTSRNFEYLAIAGGLTIDHVLGSASQDTLSGIGPAPLEAGMGLSVGRSAGSFRPVDHLVGRSPVGPVRIWPGPHLEYFGSGALERFCDIPWRVEAPVNRIATRLWSVTPERIERTGTLEIASIGLVTGAIQIHPDGAAVMMSADHPTTGGYPVIGVVDHDDIGTIAQIRPGGSVRFASVSADRTC